MPELYRFRTAGQTWRYTDARSAVMLAAQVYAPHPIKRSDWKRTLRDVEVKVTLPATLPPANQFQVTNPMGVVWLDIQSIAGVLQFTGKVIAAEYAPRKNRCTLRVVAAATILMGGVPQRRFSPSCDWNLFDADCGVDANAHRVVFAQSEIWFDGFDLAHPALAAKPDGTFDGGHVVCGHECQYVLRHVGDRVTLLAPFVVLAATNFEAFAGCAKTREVCGEKFGNLPNFGGCPFVPSKNPVISGF